MPRVLAVLSVIISNIPARRCTIAAATIDVLIQRPPRLALGQQVNWALYTPPLPFPEQRRRKLQLLATTSKVQSLNTAHFRSYNVTATVSCQHESCQHDVFRN